MEAAVEDRGFWGDANSAILFKKTSCHVLAFGQAYAYYEKVLHPYRTIGPCYGRAYWMQ
jgi:hypothetical protein